MIITHEEITQRAREIWERAGRPEGRDEEHWLQAEAELRQEKERSNLSAVPEPKAALLTLPAPAASLPEAANGRKRTAPRRSK
jgi:hypothetical protein